MIYLYWIYDSISLFSYWTKQNYELIINRCQTFQGHLTRQWVNPMLIKVTCCFRHWTVFSRKFYNFKIWCKNFSEHIHNAHHIKCLPFGLILRVTTCKTHEWSKTKAVKNGKFKTLRDCEISKFETETSKIWTFQLKITQHWDFETHHNCFQDFKIEPKTLPLYYKKTCLKIIYQYYIIPNRWIK